MADSGKSQALAARETFAILQEISKLLNTGLDAETLAICVRLCESGVNPEAIAVIIKQLRKEKSVIQASSDQNKER